jgi:hypothetical protein
MQQSQYLRLMSLACLAAGCSSVSDDGSGGDESLGTKNDALIGAPTENGNLTRKGIPIQTLTDENDRLADSDAYYAATKIGVFGTGQSIVERVGADLVGLIDTLEKFRAVYHFDFAEHVAHYYNSGDLGIGREMHCTSDVKDDPADPPAYIACYVTNFAAGDDGTEFTFGLSPSVAFTNMLNNHPFATVAMVFRRPAPANQKVFFMVYGADGRAQNFAALDRHAQNFLNTGEGTPGVNFNNHVPTNCMSCHGGSYDPSSHTATGALFLPFDLAQFEYDPRFGTEADQQETFRRLNALVRDVATYSGVAAGANVRDLLDTWHGAYDTSLHEYTQNFDRAAVLAAWNGNADNAYTYQNVVRPMCRNCHVVSAFNFNTPSALLSVSSLAVGDICGYQMPHAFQTVRKFWTTGAQSTLESFLRGGGGNANEAKPGDADTLHACRAGNAITLDPPQLFAAAF